MKTKRQKTEILKALASAAKQRLMQNGYNEKGGYRGVPVSTKAEYRLVSLDNTAEEKLYAKVKEILTSNILVKNPLSKLMNEKEFATLSQEGKERYIICLAEKYVEMKNRYELEQNQFVV